MRGRGECLSFAFQLNQVKMYLDFQNISQLQKKTHNIYATMIFIPDYLVMARMEILKIILLLF